MSALNELLGLHRDHRWTQVGPCVWCDECNQRLYQGQLPDQRDPNRAIRQATCEHDWDTDAGAGFYLLCRRCGMQDYMEEWAE